MLVLSAVLIIAGFFSELMGVLYVWEDLTGKGPGSAWRRVQRSARIAAQVLERGLARVGLRRRRNATVIATVATAWNTRMGRPRVKTTRGPDRTLEQKVTDLETDLSKMDDRTTTLEERMDDLRAEVTGLPESMRGQIQGIADERLAAADARHYPLHFRSLVCLLLGLFLSAAGGLTSLCV